MVNIRLLIYGVDGITFTLNIYNFGHPQPALKNYLVFTS